MLVINKSFENKTSAERADIKALEISKTKPSKFNKEGFEIEIVGDINKIDGGVEVFAKAFKDGNPVGFGKDGTVEIERFRFFNPPVLVDDENGDITREREEKDLNTGIKSTKQRKLKFDPEEALKQSLAHTVSVVAKDGNNIIKGKIGNTTSTFYPDAGKPGSTSVDGAIRYNAGSPYSVVHDATAGTELDANGINLLEVINYEDGGAYYMARSLINFDTSAIGDSDTIDSAAVSLYHTTAVENEDSDSLSLVLNTITSNVDYVVGDWDLFGTTKQATDIAFASLTVSAYNVLTLNATGLTNISKTSVTKFGIRTAKDISNTAPNGHNAAFFSAADTTGTTSDPKLVVEHSAGASAVIHLLSSTGVGR